MSRRNWMATDKTAIAQLMAQGLRATEIKRKLFPKDRSLKINAIAKVIERIKKNPQWASEDPGIIFNYSKTTKSKRKNRKSGMHSWTVAEKKNFVKLIKSGLSVGDIKKTYYKKDKTVTLGSLYTINYRLKKEPDWVNQEPFNRKPVSTSAPAKATKKVIAIVTQSNNGEFALDSIFVQFSNYKNTVNEFVGAINALIDENCPLSKDQRIKIQNFINAEGVTAIQNTQKELVTKLQKNS